MNEIKPRYQAYKNGWLFEIRYLDPKWNKYSKQYFIDGQWCTPSQWFAAQREANAAIRERTVPKMRVSLKL